MIYVSRLKTKWVTAEDGSYIRHALTKKIPETPYPELNQLAKTLAESDWVEVEDVLLIFNNNKDWMRILMLQVTGLCMRAFLREYRLLILREIMIYTNLSLHEAAEHLHRQKEQLSRDFSKKYGLSPIQYRQRYRNKYYTLWYEFELNKG